MLGNGRRAKVAPTSAKGDRVAATPPSGGDTSRRDPELVLRLWPGPPSSRDARRAIHAFCIDHALVDLAADAELLTSELVTNAIKHSSGLITVVAAYGGAELTVSVRDDATDMITCDGQPAADAESGRGLQIVDQIASQWGTTPHETGKSVWFRLP